MTRPLLIIAVGMMLAAENVSAAEFRLEPSRIPVGQTSTVDLWLLPAGESLNALEGELTIPPGLSATVRTGGSGVTLWLKPPSVADGKITFAGVIPGGTEGDRVRIFTLALTAGREGEFFLPLRNGLVLRHDPQGSALPVLSGELRLVADTEAGGEPPSPDLTPPAAFTPQVARDPAIFDGRYFVAFSTTDQESGIEHYEVMEVPRGTGGGDLGPWQAAESPYLLADQSLRSDIHVRAVDGAGNFVIVSLEAANPAGTNQQALYVLLLLVLILLVVRSRARIWSRLRALGD